jgi:hypothetical protein
MPPPAARSTCCCRLNPRPHPCAHRTQEEERGERFWAGEGGGGGRSGVSLQNGRRGGGQANTPHAQRLECDCAHSSAVCGVNQTRQRFRRAAVPGG